MHLKRLKSPKRWDVERKSTKFITRTNPGPHPIKESVNISVLIKEMLHIAKTTREIKRMLNEEKILVDGIVRKDIRFPVGLMDIIEIKDFGTYRLLIGVKGKFILHKVEEKEKTIKPRKIIGKKILRKNKTQINFYDGWNKIIDKSKYSVNDTLIFDLKKNEIVEHLKLEKGSVVYLTTGIYAGNYGLLEEVKVTTDLQNTTIKVKMGKNSVLTLKEYAFVIGKDKPLISVPE